MKKTFSQWLNSNNKDISYYLEQLKANKFLPDFINGIQLSTNRIGLVGGVIGDISYYLSELTIEDNFLTLEYSGVHYAGSITPMSYSIQLCDISTNSWIDLKDFRKFKETIVSNAKPTKKSIKKEKKIWKELLKMCVN